MQPNQPRPAIPQSPPPAEAVPLNLHDWCKRLGWRVTETRLAILKTAQDIVGYVDADELVKRTQRFDAGASRATVYRALPQLCEAGFLRKTEVGGGPARFSRSSPGEVPSAEIYVEDCGLILRVPAPFLTWYATSITTRVGLELIGQRLQTFARCSHKHGGGDCEQCPQTMKAQPSAA